MRLGVLGPAQGDLAALAKGAQQLLDDAGVERVIYLADDDALDRVVAGWAEAIVGENPEEEALFERAARCAFAPPEDLDRFLASERARIKLRVLSSLPHAPGRTIEILDGNVAVFVWDKALLDEEDISAATILVFGKSAEPLIKRIGSRVFFTPGPVSAAGGGRGILDDAGSGLLLEVLDATGKVRASERIAARERAPGGARMKVQGG